MQRASHPGMRGPLYVWVRPVRRAGPPRSAQPTPPVAWDGTSARCLRPAPGLRYPLAPPLRCTAPALVCWVGAPHALDAPYALHVAPKCGYRGRQLSRTAPSRPRAAAPSPAPPRSERPSDRGRVCACWRCWNCRYAIGWVGLRQEPLYHCIGHARRALFLEHVFG